MRTFPGPITAITLFADDLTAVHEFYRDRIGLPVELETENSVVFTFGNTLINLLASTEAPELIEPAIVAPQASGARMQLTVTVDDVDATAEALQQRGVTLLNGPMDRPWGIRTASFMDPAGHIWEIAS